MALIAMGKRAVDALAAALDDQNTETRWEAAKALVSIGDASAAPALVSALDDKGPGIRWLAAEALIAAGPAAVPPLLRALVNDHDSRWLLDGAHHVLHALEDSDIGPAIIPVVTALKQAAREERVPVAASEALRELGQID